MDKCIYETVIPIVIGSSYNAYGVIRSFSEVGLRSILVTYRKETFVKYSRYLLRTVYVHDPNKYEEEYIADLISLGKSLSPKRGMFFPTHDEQLLFIAKYKDVLTDYFEFPFSDYETLESIFDKSMFRSACEKIGVPVITEEKVSSLDMALNCKKKLRLPIIIKVLQWDPVTIKQLGSKTEIVTSEDEYDKTVKKIYDVLPSALLLIQEYIADSERLMPNVNSIGDKDGNLMCVFVSEKVRQYPIQTGTSTATNSVDPQDPLYADVIEYSRRIVKHFHFYGLFGIEYKYDPKDKVCKVIEMNPRSEFPNYLQTLVGQNMPVALYRYHLESKGIQLEPALAEELKHIVLPYYPKEKSAQCVVPVYDYLDSVLINTRNKKNGISKKQYKESLITPRTLYGATSRDMLAFFMTYLISLKYGTVAYLRCLMKVPKSVSTKDFLLGRAGSKKWKN